MIVGIGSDIIDINRVSNVINRFGKKFINRCFNQIEIDRSSKKLKSSASFAKRFAAKEAFAKSLGTGFKNGFNFKDISVINDKLGKPSFLITKKIKNMIKKRFKINSFNFFLSISDEKKYSIAFVIFQK